MTDTLVICGWAELQGDTEQAELEFARKLYTDHERSAFILKARLLASCLTAARLTQLSSPACCDIRKKTLAFPTETIFCLVVKTNTTRTQHGKGVN